jgi:hypothetical protein
MGGKWAAGDQPRRSAVVGYLPRNRAPSPILAYDNVREILAVRSSSQPLCREFRNVAIRSEAADRQPNPDVRFRLTDPRQLPFRLRPAPAIGSPGLEGSAVVLRSISGRHVLTSVAASGAKWLGG